MIKNDIFLPFHIMSLNSNFLNKTNQVRRVSNLKVSRRKSIDAHKNRPNQTKGF